MAALQEDLEREVFISGFSVGCAIEEVFKNMIGSNVLDSRAWFEKVWESVFH